MLTIYVGKLTYGNNFHVIYCAGGQFAHGIETEVTPMTICPLTQEWVENGREFVYWYKIRLPIRHPERSMRTGSRCINCVTAALGAWWRGL